MVAALDNSFRHQEALSQKTLGENLLQMMPTAVVTVRPDVPALSVDVPVAGTATDVGWSSVTV